jgi:HEAT repeat protein
VIPQVLRNSWKSSLWLVAGMLACLFLLGRGPVYGQSDNTSQPASEVKSSNNKDARKNAIAKKNAVKDSRDVKKLIAALKDKDRIVRGTAAANLGEIKSVSAVKPLIRALKDGDPWVRAQADASLIEIGPPAVEPLIAVLKENDPFIPALSAVALTKIKDPRADSALMTALREQNAKVILGAHTFYVKLGVPGTEAALIETLKKYPSREIAEEYRYCGNPALVGAANEWARKYNQKLGPALPGGAVQWGSGREAPPPTTPVSQSSAPEPVSGPPKK